MSTYTHPLQPTHINRIPLVQQDDACNSETKQLDFVAPEDNGLGCIRGLVVAMFLYVILALMLAAGSELWRLLR